MRLVVAAADPPRAVQRHHRIARAHRAGPPLVGAVGEGADIEIDHARQQHRLRPDHPPDAAAGIVGIALGGHGVVVARRIAVLEVVGHAALGPQHDAGLAVTLAGEAGEALELLLELGGVVDLGLRDVGLDEGVAQVGIVRRAPADHVHHGRNRGYCCKGGDPAVTSVIHQHGGRRGNGEAGHGIGARPGQHGCQSGPLPPAQQHQPERRPRVAGERPAPQPLGDHPRA